MAAAELFLSVMGKANCRRRKRQVSLYLFLHPLIMHLLNRDCNSTDLPDCVRANGNRNPSAQRLVRSKLSVSVNYQHVGLTIVQVPLQELRRQRQLKRAPHQES